MTADYARFYSCASSGCGFLAFMLIDGRLVPVVMAVPERLR